MKVLIVILLAILSSCTSVKYVPVETVKNDTTYVHSLRVDSVYVRDSVIIERGDTIKELRYKYIYRYINNTDTLYISKTDSIQVPYPIERNLTRWERIRLDYGGYAIATLFALIIIFIRMNVKP